MRTLPQPDNEQLQIIDAPIEDLLVLAPAGSGKTLALALRAARLLKKPELAQPRKILALSFSNRAKANLSSYISAAVGLGWRDRVDVMNFHGFAARVVRAHGALIELDPELVMPDTVWRARLLDEIPWARRPAVEAALRAAKAGAFTDDEVAHRLDASNVPEAVAIENDIRMQNRMDYDDIVRHALRLLNVGAVAAAYSTHFAAFLVDEVQDLRLTQFALVESIGLGKTTFAGDPSQGIYGFAGAEPADVMARLSARCGIEIRLTRSYRSSQAVLNALNCFVPHSGGHPLTSAFDQRGDAPPYFGEVLTLESSNSADEATQLIAYIRDQVERYPRHSIGVIARRNNRLDHIRRVLTEMNVPFEDWLDAEHDTTVAKAIATNLQEALASSADAPVQLETLANLCATGIDASDVDSLDALAKALSAIADDISRGLSVADAVISGRSTRDSDEHAGPGVHLLNGHIGKGQEFDVVIVVGLEEGHIPDFRSTHGEPLAEEARVLHVMLSRARRDLVLTRCDLTDTRYGPRTVAPSPWWQTLQAAVTRSLSW